MSDDQTLTPLMRALLRRCENSTQTCTLVKAGLETIWSDDRPGVDGDDEEAAESESGYGDDFDEKVEAFHEQMGALSERLLALCPDAVPTLPDGMGSETAYLIYFTETEILLYDAEQGLGPMEDRAFQIFPC